MPERRFLIRIHDLPDPAEQRDLLELILAAASLEIELTVVLGQNAVELLSLEAFQGWKQLSEQHLACVGVAGPWEGAALPGGVAVFDERQRAKLARECTVLRV